MESRHTPFVVFYRIRRLMLQDVGLSVAVV